MFGSEHTSSMHQKQAKTPSMNRKTCHFAIEFKSGPKTFMNKISIASKAASIYASNTLHVCSSDHTKCL
jgi:hypothetical protein